jgi:hypothetical protein
MSGASARCTSDSTLPPAASIAVTIACHCSRVRTGSGWSSRRMNGLIA